MHSCDLTSFTCIEIDVVIPNNFLLHCIVSSIYTKQSKGHALHFFIFIFILLSPSIAVVITILKCLSYKLSYNNNLTQAISLLQYKPLR